MASQCCFCSLCALFSFAVLFIVVFFISVGISIGSRGKVHNILEDAHITNLTITDGPNGSSSSSGVESSTGDGQDEVLVIQGVGMSREDYVNLKVFVNMPTADAKTPIYTAEYVGSTVIVPSPDAGKQLFSNIAMEVGDNLLRLGLESEDYLVVTIVVDSFSGTSPVTIRGMKIEYRSSMCNNISSST